MKKYKYVLFFIVGILIDQITKIAAYNSNVDISVIPGVLNFTLVKNYGAAFGIAQGANTILAIISLVVCIAILVIMYLQKKNGEKISISLYLILIGGVGNLIDRLARGFVVDFIDTPFIATFNIADSLIVIGAIWTLIEEVCKSIFKKS